MWRSITTIIMVLLALAGRSEAQGSSHTDEEAVRSNADAWMAAWNNGDAHAIAQLVTEDYEVVWPDGTHIKGREAFENSLANTSERRQATPTLNAPAVF